MSSFSRLCLYLVVSFCLAQVTFAKLNKRLFKNVEFALKKLASEVKHELDHEKLSFQHKLKIQFNDYKRKAASKESLDCIKKSWLLAEESIIANSNEGKDCIRRVNGEIDLELNKPLNLEDIDDFTIRFKEKLQKCKTGAVNKISPVLKQFHFKVKNCNKY